MKEKAMKDSRPLISSHFSIHGETLDPQDCTKTIGIIPTFAGRKGTKRRPGSLVALQTSIWTVSFSKEPSYSTDEEISRLIDLLWPHRLKVREYLSSTGFEAGFGNSVTIYEDRPLYSLSSSTIQRIAVFGVDYGLDVFDYSK